MSPHYIFRKNGVLGATYDCRCWALDVLNPSNGIFRCRWGEDPTNLVYFMGFYSDFIGL